MTSPTQTTDVDRAELVKRLRDRANNLARLSGHWPHEYLEWNAADAIESCAPASGRMEIDGYWPAFSSKTAAAEAEISKIERLLDAIVPESLTKTPWGERNIFGLNRIKIVAALNRLRALASSPATAFTDGKVGTMEAAREIYDYHQATAVEQDVFDTREIASIIERHTRGVK